MNTYCADLAERERERRQDHVRRDVLDVREAALAPPGVALSPPGSHSRLPAKIPMKIIPSQKSGIE